MRQRGKLSAGSIVIVLGTLALAGCSAGESSFADLRGEAQEGPALPGGMPEDALESFDEETIRWVGSSGDTELWLGEGRTPDAACLLVHPADGSWSSTCTTSDAVVELDGSYLIVPDSASVPSDATAISENVYSRS